MGPISRSEGIVFRLKRSQEPLKRRGDVSFDLVTECRVRPRQRAFNLGLVVVGLRCPACRHHRQCREKSEQPSPRQHQVASALD